LQILYREDLRRRMRGAGQATQAMHDA